MSGAVLRALQPRKMPVQARSTATVEAILEATIQVLLEVGKERLTTTQVARRAGVSVGTLYQYFPNKSSLLQACLRRHIEEVSGAILKVCDAHQGAGLLEMAAALISSYLDAKMRHPKISVALYSVSSDVDGAAIARAAGERAHQAVVRLFATSKDRLTRDTELVATAVLGALSGVTRTLLEGKAPERRVLSLREELITLVHAYLRASGAK